MYEDVSYTSKSRLMVEMELYYDAFMNGKLDGDGYLIEGIYDGAFSCSIETDEFGEEIHFVDVYPEDGRFNNDDLHIFSSKEAAVQWMDAYQGSGELTYYSVAMDKVLELLSTCEKYDDYFEDSTEKFILEKTLDNFSLVLKEVGFRPEDKEEFVNHFHGAHRERVLAAFAEAGF